MIGRLTKFAALKILVLAIPLILLAASYSVAQNSPAGLSMLKKTTAENSGEEIQIPKGLAPEEVDAFLASLSDEQARKVLARKLKKDAAENKTVSDQEKTAEKAGHHFDCLYKFENDLAHAKEQVSNGRTRLID